MEASLLAYLVNSSSVSLLKWYLGAASMAVNTGKHPVQLKYDIASPGGTTIARIHELEKAELDFEEL
ncbi:hypothetical protein OROMI_010301 [Orobanche minor]